MISVSALDPRLVALGKAIGLISDGHLNPAWFQAPSPIASLQQILTNPQQRAALLEFLAAEFPPEQLTGGDPGEIWYPLLEPQPRGNVYLTVSSGATQTFGIGAQLTGNASLRVKIDLWPQTQVTLRLRVPLGLRLPADAIGLDAVAISVEIGSAGSTARVLLERLDTGSGARNTVLDPHQLGPDATRLIIGLVKQNLTGVAAAGEAASVRNHLLGLIGFDGTSIPPFPLDGTGMVDWIRSVPLDQWLPHAAGLFGEPVALVRGSGTPRDPWNVSLLPLGAGELELIASRSDTLNFGLRVTVPATGVSFEGLAYLTAIPLSGSGAAAVLPAGSIAIRSTASPKLATSPQIQVTAFRGALEWTAGQFRPVLELLDVDFEGQHHDRIDLTNADAAVAAASAAIIPAILAALGPSGRPLAALAGLVPPSRDPASPHASDAGLFVAQPTRAIAAFHRSVLLDATHNWSFLLAEIADLAGIAAAVTGTGSIDDPWRVPLGASAPLGLELCASSSPSEPRPLRLVVRLHLQAAPFELSVEGDLLAFKLPATGEATAGLMSGAHLVFRIAPAFDTELAPGRSIGASSLEFRADWSTGASLVWRAAINQLTLTLDGRTITVPQLLFPSPAGFDIGNAAATAALYGISVDDLETLLRALVSAAALLWGGNRGHVAAGLLGLHNLLSDVPAGWPVLSDPGGPGSLLSDPFGSLRKQLAAVALNSSVTGDPFLLAALKWLAAIVSDGLPDAPADRVPDFDTGVEGCGRYEEPWRLQSLALWLEPAGPPAAWCSALGSQAGTAADWPSLMTAVRNLALVLPGIAQALGGRSPDDLTNGLLGLLQHLGLSDGIVPASSHFPSGPNWTAGELIHAPHALQPKDPDAIRQILAQIDTWAGGPAAPRLVLLIGPPFSDHSVWTDLLGSPNRHGATDPAAHFNLRISGVDPLTVDLAPVQVAADYYTADLSDSTGDLDKLVAQIARIVTRLAELRPGVRVTLVAHSTAGLAARSFAEANAAQVRGLITLGTPHFGAPLPFLADAGTADAVRFLRATLPDLAGPMAEVLREIAAAMDGYRPAAPGLLPQPVPFPLAFFSVVTENDTGGPPSFALGGALSFAALDEVKKAFVAASAAEAASRAGDAAPTHLAFALRAPVGGGVATGGQDIRAWVRVGAGRVALQNGAPNPPRAPHAIGIDLDVTRPGGWLTGAPSGPLVTPPDVHVRSLRLSLDLTPDGATVKAVARGRLIEPAYHGPVAISAEITDPVALPLLGAVFQDIAAAPGSEAGRLLTILRSLGLLVDSVHGGLGFSADALVALTTNGATLPFFAARLPDLGVLGPPGISLTLDRAPWRLNINTALGGLTLSSGITFPAFDFTAAYTLRLGDFQITREGANVSLEAPGWFPRLSLFPLPGAADLARVLNDFLPRLLLSTGASAFLQALVSPAIRIGPIDQFFSHTGQSASRSSAVGNGARLQASRINLLLEIIGKTVGIPGPGLSFPVGVRLDSVDISDTTAIRFGTTAPLGGVIGFQASVALDSGFNATPAGTITITIPHVVLTFGLGTEGLTVALTFDANPPIQLLPQFSGFGALLGGAQALLPAALDAVTGALGSPLPTLAARALDVAARFGLYDAVGRFGAHAAELRAMSQPGWALAGVAAAGRLAALQAIQQLLLTAGVPGTLAIPGATTLVWSSGGVSMSLGWDGAGCVLLVRSDGLKRAAGAITAGFSFGYANGKIEASLRAEAALQSSLGLDVSPKLKVAYTGASFDVAVLPLARGAVDGPLRLSLAPAVVLQLDPNAETELLQSLLLPLTADLVFNATKPNHTDLVWTGGRTVRDLLVSAGIADSGDPTHLKTPLPGLPAMVFGLLSGLAGGAEIPLDARKGLKLQFVHDNGKLGFALSGNLTFSAGGHEITVYFGTTLIKTAGFSQGLEVLLFTDAGSFGPETRFLGIGLGLRGAEGRPLVNLSQFRLGGLGGFLSFSIPFTGLGAGMDLEQLGLPLGLITSGVIPPANPIVASLLESGGAPGEQQPVNPRIDVAVWSTPSDPFGISLSATTVIWIGIHQAFGPIYIDQVGLRLGDAGVELMIDGSVKVFGLQAQAKELGVTMAFRDLLAPERWSLDLKGLAISFTAPGVAIAGAFLKDTGPPLQYSGMLVLTLNSLGFLAVGAYSQPQEGGDSYTSLFIYGAVFVPIGLPPVVEISGLALGVGYNRRILPPQDLNQIPDFILVKALDRPEVFAEDPMGELLKIGREMPPRRGSMWLAVGLRGTSFAVVNVTAVLYVALDRGIEIGILGVARIALPTDDTALIRLELALKARFSSAEGVLSIQAQLTDNCWFLLPNCKLTGGFAFYMCFPDAQFLLTIGGYHPQFQPPPKFPQVPRLGYQYSFGVYSIKGESYFAITNTCVMFGARIELSYGFDWLKAWLTAYGDFLISWDPFYFTAKIGIEVGALVRIKVCVFACVTVQLSFSIGASLELAGPPLHGSVTLDLDVTSLTIPFGSEPNYQTIPISWNQFQLKYLQGSDPGVSPVTVQAIDGVLPPEPPGGKPAPGTESQPWKLTAEWAMQTTSTMAFLSFLGLGGALGPKLDGVYDRLDIGPMGKEDVGSAHNYFFFARRNNTWSLAFPRHLEIKQLVTQLSEALWRNIDHEHVPAAANTLPAGTGLQIIGHARAENPTAAIPIATLVDTGNHRPLPFASNELFVLLVEFGLAGVALTPGLTLQPKGILAVSQIVLSGQEFQLARRAAGIPESGLTGMAVRGLISRRSSPPLLAPITANLTMEPVGQPAPPVIASPPAVELIPLQSVQLKSVLQSAAPPIAGRPPAIRTTVARKDLPRTAPPKAPFVSGARLERVADPQAAAPTIAAAATRTIRSAGLGAPNSAAHEAAFERLSAQLTAGGVEIRAGATYLWDLHPAAKHTLRFEGNSAGRVSFLSATGRVLSDIEFPPGAREFTAPAECQSLAIGCLGRLPSGIRIEPGMGAVSAAVASFEGTAATGWQSGSMAAQVGSASLLARGASLTLAQAATAIRHERAVGQSMVRLSSTMTGLAGAETWLPLSTKVVLLLLDEQDPTAVDNGDFALAVDGGRLAPPLRVAGGRRQALLYDVIERTAGADHLSIATASLNGVRLAGVIGLPGTARQQATVMNGAIPEHFIADGPITPDGSIRVVLTSSGEPV